MPSETPRLNVSFLILQAATPIPHVREANAVKRDGHLAIVTTQLIALSLAPVHRTGGLGCRPAPTAICTSSGRL